MSADGLCIFPRLRSVELEWIPWRSNYRDRGSWTGKRVAEGPREKKKRQMEGEGVSWCGMR